MRSVFLQNQPSKIVRVNVLSQLGQPTEEVVHIVLVFVALTQVVLEFRVYLSAFLHNVYIILESLHGILENFVQLLHIAFENLFHPLALTDPLLPDFVLRLEI